MRHTKGKSQSGFTLLEIMLVVLVAGIIGAIAVPRITNAMRSHRLTIATRQVIDTMKRAKMTAVSQNRTSAIGVDINGRRMGVVMFNADGTVNSVEYIPLPEGVSFQRPPGVTANPAGVTGANVVSFKQSGGFYRQDFNSRGFPTVAFGATVSIFLGNGRDYNAVTMTSVGGVQAFRLSGGEWTSTQAPRSSESSDGNTNANIRNTNGNSNTRAGNGH
jgi:prepilin-type N-terminal cleavage/methylation domain-containing protein